jgi:hypothetical protein
MRKYLAAAVIVLAATTSPARTAAMAQTITGKVIDLYCYSRDNKATGMDHRDGRECALACVKWEGQPVGLLTAEGKVYQLAGEIVAHNNAKVVPHLTHTVTVRGDVVDRDGLMTIFASDLTMVGK